MSKVLIKISLFLFLIFFLQRTINDRIGPSINPQFSGEINKIILKMGNNADVYFLGDSVISSVAENDQNREDLASLVKEKLGQKMVVNISHPAFHGLMYQSQAVDIVHKQEKPRVVIVPVNMQIFGQIWDYRPEYQFVNEKTYFDLLPYPLLIDFYKPLLTFKFNEYKPIYQNLYDHKNAQLNWPETRTVTIEDYKRMFEAQYMDKIEVSNRQLQALITTGKILQSAKIAVVYYITPMNYQLGQKFLGDKLIDLVSTNKQVIINSLQHEGFKIIDLAFSLDHSNFDWNYGNIPTAHLKFDGREFVASHIALEVQKYFQ